MEPKRNYFELISSQRYFHLIAFKVDTKYSLEDFWKQCGLIIKTNFYKEHKTDAFTIQQNRIISDFSFYNGEKDFSVNKDGESPFNYDVFAVNLFQEQILIFGFPFKFLAKKILSTLIEDYNLLKKGTFMKCDLNKLIKLNDDYIINSEHFSAYFSGVDLILSGDTNITSVGLDGDKPLDSILYKTFFEERIKNDECMLDKCSVKCETISSLPKTKSNIHVDVFGNYKLYVHGSGNNIFTIPYLFEAFYSLGCLKQTITNPINRLNDE